MSTVLKVFKYIAIDYCLAKNSFSIFHCRAFNWNFILFAYFDKVSSSSEV